MAVSTTKAWSTSSVKMGTPGKINESTLRLGQSPRQLGAVFSYFKGWVNKPLLLVSSAIWSAGMRDSVAEGWLAQAASIKQQAANMAARKRKPAVMLLFLPMP